MQKNLGKIKRTVEEYVVREHPKVCVNLQTDVR